MMKPQRRITKARFKLAIKHYTPFIQRFVYRMATSSIQAEEFRSYALEELLKCMICYKYGYIGDYGVATTNFSTLFHDRIMGAFMHAREVEKRSQRSQLVPVESMVTIPAAAYDVDASMIAQECLECLTDEERYIIIKLFFSGQTMREVSVDCGVVHSTIYRTKVRAINKMRQKFMVK